MGIFSAIKKSIGLREAVRLGRSPEVNKDLVASELLTLMNNTEGCANELNALVGLVDSYVKERQEFLNTITGKSLDTSSRMVQNMMIESLLDIINLLAESKRHLDKASTFNHRYVQRGYFNWADSRIPASKFSRLIYAQQQLLVIGAELETASSKISNSIDKLKAVYSRVKDRTVEKLISNLENTLEKVQSSIALTKQCGANMEILITAAKKEASYARA